jgi:lambda repressor-like predicted transcriptional regulator
VNRLQRAAKKRAAAEAEWKQAIREAHAEGRSLRSIAHEAGCSHERVRQVLAERA